MKFRRPLCDSAVGCHEISKTTLWWCRRWSYYQNFTLYLHVHCL